MHFKIPQGLLIQQKEIGKAHLHFVFVSLKPPLEMAGWILLTWHSEHFIPC